MINDHKRSEYQCQSTLIWTWLGEENYGNKRSYSEVQVGQKSLCTFSEKFVNLKKARMHIVSKIFQTNMDF